MVAVRAAMPRIERGHAAPEVPAVRPETAPVGAGNGAGSIALGEVTKSLVNTRVSTLGVPGYSVRMWAPLLFLNSEV
jgi:hypothetical protein